MEEVTIVAGEALYELRKLEDNSVDSVVTDPPYGLNSGRNRFHDVFFSELFDVFFPKFYKNISERIDNIDLVFPFQRISFLNFMNRTIWKEPGVTVPKRPIGFYDDFVVWA
jgi:DNA modification methylase